MKRPTRTVGTAAICLALTALFCATAIAEDKTPEFKGSIAVEPHAKQMLSLARVAFLDAAATASKSENAGQAIEAELDVENGSLVYGFDFIAPSGAHTKVLVDAGDGKLLATLKQTPTPCRSRKATASRPVTTRTAMTDLTLLRQMRQKPRYH
jgi:hypothetical protein